MIIYHARSRWRHLEITKRDACVVSADIRGSHLRGARCRIGFNALATADARKDAPRSLCLAPNAADPLERRRERKPSSNARRSRRRRKIQGGWSSCCLAALKRLPFDTP